MTQVQSDFLSAFNQFFELIPATTPELKRQVYILRYQVYALETGFERVEDCKSALDSQGELVHWEEDEYDPRSEHYLVLHRRTGIYAATTRMILPDPRDIGAPFPIELHCQLDRRITEPEARLSIGEISRFAVSKHFKRRLGEAGSIAGVAEDVEVYLQQDERRVLPHLSLGLLAAVVRIAHARRISHMYAVMEPALYRLLGRFGVVFETIGPTTDYHGMRTPCLITMDETMPNIHRACAPLWNLMTDNGRQCAGSWR